MKKYITLLFLLFLSSQISAVLINIVKDKDQQRQNEDFDFRINKLSVKTNVVERTVITNKVIYTSQLIPDYIQGNLDLSGNLSLRNFDITNVHDLKTQNMTVIGDMEVANMQVDSMTVNGNITAVNITGSHINTTSMTVTGNISTSYITGSSITISGNISGSQINASSMTLTGSVTTTSINSANMNIASMTVSGNVTSNSININNLTASGQVQAFNLVVTTITTGEVIVTTVTSQFINLDNVVSQINMGGGNGSMIANPNQVANINISTGTINLYNIPSAGGTVLRTHISPGLIQLGSISGAIGQGKLFLSSGTSDIDFAYQPSGWGKNYNQIYCRNGKDLIFKTNGIPTMAINYNNDVVVCSEEVFLSTASRSQLTIMGSNSKVNELEVGLGTSTWNGSEWILAKRYDLVVSTLGNTTISGTLACSSATFSGSITASSMAKIRGFLWGSNQTIPTGVSTVKYDTKEFDNTSGFDVTSGSVTIKRSAYYNIYATALFLSEANKTYLGYISLNDDIDLAQSRIISSGVAAVSVSVSTLVYLNQNDIICFKIINNGVGSTTVYSGGGNNGSKTYFYLNEIP